MTGKLKEATVKCQPEHRKEKKTIISPKVYLVDDSLLFKPLIYAFNYKSL